jgi:hypothetical protein
VGSNPAAPTIDFNSLLALQKHFGISGIPTGYHLSPWSIDRTDGLKCVNYSSTGALARSASNSSSVRSWRLVIRRVCTDCCGHPKPRSSKAKDVDTTAAGGDFGLSRALASAAIDAGPSS